jgi:hypothetical protein
MNNANILWEEGPENSKRIVAAPMARASAEAGGRPQAGGWAGGRAGKAGTRAGARSRASEDGRREGRAGRGGEGAASGRREGGRGGRVDLALAFDRRRDDPINRPHYTENSVQCTIQNADV